jgi:hypothetical protein
MATWLAPKKAANYIKEQNPETMIGEKTIRDLIKQGFPCLRISTRALINVDTFEEDLKEHITKTVPQNEEEVVISGIRRIAG